VVVPSPVDTIFDFRAAYRSENLPHKYEQLALLFFGQHPRLTAVEQDWANQGLVNNELSVCRQSPHFAPRHESSYHSGVPESSFKIAANFSYCFWVVFAVIATLNFPVFNFGCVYQNFTKTMFCSALKFEFVIVSDIFSFLLRINLIIKYIYKYRKIRNDNDRIL
jgi:hypothetical protein